MADGEGSTRLLQLLSGAWTTQALYVAAELGLADLLAEGPRTAAVLAERTGADERALRRLLDALAAAGIVRADAGRYELTPTGASLRSLHAWALWWGRSLWPAWGNLLRSVRTGESGRDTRGFEHLADDPEAAAVFYRATVELSRLGAPAILRAFDFSGARRIVDVGGGWGELLARILAAHPDATGILFELPAAVSGARRHLAECGVGGRCEVVAGDFFAEVPGGADVYLLKAVLHDWPDDRAGRILAACRRAMDERARLVIVEQVRDGGPDAAVSDLTMLVAHGAGERTLEEFRALLAAAGLELARAVPVERSLHVLEARPV